jgi:hypothetical protein
MTAAGSRRARSSPLGRSAFRAEPFLGSLSHSQTPVPIRRGGLPLPRFRPRLWFVKTPSPSRRAPLLSRCPNNRQPLITEQRLAAATAFASPRLRVGPAKKAVALRARPEAVVASRMTPRRPATSTAARVNQLWTRPNPELARTQFRDKASKRPDRGTSSSRKPTSL